MYILMGEENGINYSVDNTDNVLTFTVTDSENNVTTDTLNLTVPNRFGISASDIALAESKLNALMIAASE